MMMMRNRERQGIEISFSPSSQNEIMSAILVCTFKESVHFRLFPSSISERLYFEVCGPEENAFI